MATIPTLSTIPQSVGFLPESLAELIASTLSAFPMQRYQKTAADGAAATATAETPIGRAPATCTVGTVFITPLAALTADNTNYATITIFKRTGAGGTVQIAQVTTQITGSGNWTAFIPVAVPVTAGAVAAGDAITFTITKAGSGVVVPVATIEMFLA